MATDCGKLNGRDVSFLRAVMSRNGHLVDQASQDPADVGQEPGDPEEVVRGRPEGVSRAPAGDQSQQPPGRKMFYQLL